MSFGDRLKQAREKNKLSQQDLANLLNITDGTISNYEKGVAFPRWDKIIRLCDILGVNPNYLFWDDLNDNMKSKIMEQMTFEYNDEGIFLYRQLDTEDQAEIRGEMKQMLKADKYNMTSETKPKRKLFSGPQPARVAAYGMEVTNVNNLKNNGK